MKIEIQINNDIKLELQTKSIRAHSILSDNPELIEAIKKYLRLILSSGLTQK